MVRKHIITEKAMSTDEASAKRLGLAVISQRERYYIIYDVEKFATGVAIHLEKSVGHKSKNFNRQALLRKEAYLQMKESIVAWMSTKQKAGLQWDAAEVTSSAAEKGWGPLIYDIAMAMEGGLLPDRGTVKPAARKVWAHFYEKRKDVRAMPLDDENEPQTDEKGDDTTNLYAGYNSENPLDYAYFASSFPNTAAMSANHETGVRLSKVSEKEYDDALLDCADAYFERRYHEG